MRQIDILDLTDKILCEFSTFKPLRCRLFDDPRCDTYYISIMQNVYIIIREACDSFEDLSIYKNNNIQSDIMTQEGLDNFTNYRYCGDIESDDDDNELLYQYENEFDDWDNNTDIDDIICEIIDELKQAIFENICI